jgi:predicted DNA-binding transcriptional regulator AlpA
VESNTPTIAKNSGSQPDTFLSVPVGNQERVMAVGGWHDAQETSAGECSWVVLGNRKKGTNMTKVAKDRPDVGELSPLLTVREVAGVLGIHVRTVWRLAAMVEMGEGVFPRPVRIAKKTIRWRREDLEKYLDSLAAEAAGERSGDNQDEPRLATISL